MDIAEDPRVGQWFEMSGFTPSTRHMYVMYLKFFCNCAEKSPTELIDESIREMKSGLLVGERNIVPYITKYRKWLGDNNYAPKTQALAISTVKSFYQAFDIQLPSRLCKVKKSLPQRKNQNFLRREDIIKLITNAKNLRDRAIMLCMASSGMARNEILNMRIRDIDFDKNDIGTVTVRREKKQVDYITFISPEATAALRNYFDERNRCRETAIKDENGFVFVTYQSNETGIKGSKLNERTFLTQFKTLGGQLGYDNSRGGFVKSRSHALRKFFASTLENAGMPKFRIDFMLGHTQTGNDLAYFHIDVEKLKELYIKYLPYLTFEKGIQINTNEDEIEEMRNKYEDMKTEVDKLKTANLLSEKVLAVLMADPDAIDDIRAELVKASASKPETVTNNKVPKKDE